MLINNIIERRNNKAINDFIFMSNQLKQMYNRRQRWEKFLQVAPVMQKILNQNVYRRIRRRLRGNPLSNRNRGQRQQRNRIGYADYNVLPRRRTARNRNNYIYNYYGY